jgi:predicted amino acid racemase
MSGGPFVTVDLDVIQGNARAIVALCRRHEIRVMGVTKGAAGSPEVARAMLRGGVAALGDSRLVNAERLRAAGVDAELALLRIPSLSRVEAIVEHFDVSLNSEIELLAGLSAASLARGTVHDVVVMIDVGDLREGLWPEELPAFARAAARLEGVRIVGVGTNLSCYGGVVPTEDNLHTLVACAEVAEGVLDRPLARVSGGATNALPLVAAGVMPARVNELRVGEGILIGCDTVARAPLPGTRQDAFLLHAEVIELKRKPSVPVGERSEDAFGRMPVFEDRGLINRAIVNVGRVDVDLETIRPVDPRFAILGASSDHLIVDVTAARDEVRLGGRIVFSLGYGALVTAMTSPYLERRFLGAEAGERGE